MTHKVHIFFRPRRSCWDPQRRSAAQASTRNEGRQPSRDLAKISLRFSSPFPAQTTPRELGVQEERTHARGDSPPAAKGIAAGRHDMGIMAEAIEQGGSEFLVAETLSCSENARDDGGAASVACANSLNNNAPLVRSSGTNSGSSMTKKRDFLMPLLEHGQPPFVAHLDQALHRVGCGGEKNPQAAGGWPPPPARSRDAFGRYRSEQTHTAQFSNSVIVQYRWPILIRTCLLLATATYWASSLKRECLSTCSTVWGGGF